MAAKRSAGLVLFRRPGGGSVPTGDDVEVLIGHMGGPLWAKRDERAWSFPKGEYAAEEEPTAAARREFQEELGLAPPDGAWLPLGESRQSSGKVVTLWALAGEVDLDLVVPGTFTMEWPPRSGRIQEFPEIDRVAWAGVAQAREKLVAGQTVFLDRLLDVLAADPSAGAKRDES
ncbi:NUDIX domain-containing protein [Streptomyces sp. NPDC048057]|uniref:NUDIX domain-containing protein n=1 Tax=Streptomyces sp. NPDC048057 TaxID=3155628 RepID=UPI0034084199